MFETAWFFSTWDLHIQMTRWLKVLNDRRPADLKSLYMRKGIAEDAASVSEFVKLLVQWFQRADEKLCLERILTMLRVAFCFVFLFFCVLQSFGFLAHP